jgi:hypothetical protein
MPALYVLIGLAAGLTVLYFVRQPEAKAGSKIYITGDTQSVGAKILVDGKEAGVMVEKSYAIPEGSKVSTARDGQYTFAEGVDNLNGKVPEDLRVTDGRHEIAFEKAGQSVKKAVAVNGDSLMNINFSKKEIRYE